MSDKVHECQICGRQHETRLDALRHIHDTHSLDERLAGLVEKTQRAEDTYA